MSKTIFISGGARSGKSRLAEKLAEGFGDPLCYIATGEARDGEMAERIANHRQRRGDAWQTVEEPLQLVEAIRETNGCCRAILVDCITLWITNLLFHHDAVEPVLAEVRALARTPPYPANTAHPGFQRGRHGNRSGKCPGTQLPRSGRTGQPDPGRSS